MLEKNKDYVEFTLQCTTVERTRDKDYREVCFNGYSDYDFPGVPMDVVCKDFNHKVVMISKRDFEALEKEVKLFDKEIAQWKAITKCETPEAAETWMRSYRSNCDVIKKWCNETDCPSPGAAGALLRHYSGENKKLQTENEQLKKKLSEFDFMGWMESAKLWKGRYNDLSKLVGFSSEQEIEDYLVNEAECDTLHEAISKLKDQVKYTCDEWYSANSTNNSWKVAAECNSPKELIEKREALEKEIGICSRTLNEWKEGTGCPSPSAAKTLIESGASWCHAYGDVKKQNEKLAEEIKKWKTLTKCETPEAAATWITSYESACGRGNRLAESVEKLKEEVVSWKNVTGYSTPEDYMHARISGAFHTPFDYTSAWQKATGCNAPDDVEIRIKALNERIDEAEADYNHLLNLTGFESEGEIEDALDRCDHSTLRKALVDYEFDYEELLKLTGYKSNHDIRVLLNDSEQFIYKDMRELINSLKRKAKFTESNWQKATGCDTPDQVKSRIEGLENAIRLTKMNMLSELEHKIDEWQKATGFSTPEKCSSYIDRLEKKLEDIKNLTEED